MPDHGSFEQHFRQRADLVEDLYTKGWRNEAHLIASVGLDSLSAVWAHDFPDQAKGMSDAVRFRSFVQRFADDPKTRRVAVVLFAQDLQRHASVLLREAAGRMLDTRAATLSRARPMEFYEWPHQHKDCSWEALLQEEPNLRAYPALACLAERYTYPALVYSLFRCGVAHTLLKGSRTHDFSSSDPDDEISYAPPMAFSGRTRPLSIKFGLKVITGWLRTSATSYAQHCRDLGVRPADDFDPSLKSLDQLENAWLKAERKGLI
jgi:hypothetical protein